MQITDYILLIFVMSVAVKVTEAIPTQNRYDLHRIDDIERRSEIETDPNFQQAIHNILHSSEYRHLRDALTLVLRDLDSGASLGEEIISGDVLSSLDMPFYFEYLKSLLNSGTSLKSIRRHRKRALFDPISHNGGLGGLGGTHRREKLEFTFENLLPYLLREMERKRRGTSSAA